MRILRLSHHLKQEDEHLEVAKSSAHAYVVESNFKKFSNFKQKWHKFKKEKGFVQ